MRKTIEFSVPVPCHENWNNMTPNEQGRFCSSCQKDVVDFTKMSEYELILYFKNINQNTCGRFRNDQLNKEMLLEQPKKLNWFKYFIQLVIPTLLITSKGYTQGKPRENVKVNKEVSMKDEPILLGEVATIPADTIRPAKLAKKHPAAEVQQKRALAVKRVAREIKKVDPLETVQIATPSMIGSPVVADYFDKLKPISQELPVGQMFICTVGGISIQRRQVTRSQQVKKVLIDSMKLLFANSSKIKIYPNPISRTKPLRFEYVAKTAGEYSIVIIDLNGKFIQGERIAANSRLIQRQVFLSETMSAGTYFLQLFGPDGKLSATQQIIVGD